MSVPVAYTAENLAGYMHSVLGPNVTNVLGWSAPDSYDELVIDAIVEPEDLREEIIKRFRYAARRDRHFSSRHRGIPPV